MFEWMILHTTDLLEIVAAAIALATVVTRMTPTPKDDEFLKKLVLLFSMMNHKDSDKKYKLPLTPGKKK